MSESDPSLITRLETLQIKSPQFEEPLYVQQLLEALPVGIFILKTDGTPHYANQDALHILGQGILTDTQPDNLADTYQAYIAGTQTVYPTESLPIIRALRGEESSVMDLEICRPSGERVPLQVWGAPILNAQGEVEYGLAVFASMVDLKKAEKRQRTQKKRAESLLKFSRQMNENLDLDTRLNIITKFLPKLAQAELFSLLLLSDNQQELQLLIHNHEAWQGIAKEKVALEKNTLMSAAIKARRPVFVKDMAASEYQARGHDKYTEGAALCIPLILADQVQGVINFNNFNAPVDDSLILYLNQIAMHISLALRNSRLYLQTVELSIKDTLTQCYNRRYFMQEMDKENQRWRRYGTPFTVALMDIDFFKKVNDTYGHGAGDQVLREAAQVFRSGIRPMDLVARYGGEEFALLLPNTRAADALNLAERLRETLANQPIVYEDQQIAVSISMGLAEVSMNTTPDALLHQADKALYQSKSEGRNRVSIAQTDIP